MKHSTDVFAMQQDSSCQTLTIYHKAGVERESLVREALPQFIVNKYYSIGLQSRVLGNYTLVNRFGLLSLLLSFLFLTNPKNITAGMRYFLFWGDFLGTGLLLPHHLYAELRS